MKSYYEYLDPDYFDGLCLTAINSLEKGDNVCVSSFSGGGRKTYLNLLLLLLKKRKSFEKIILYDPTLEDIDPVKFVKNALKNNSSRNLFIIRLFELIPEKVTILERLQALKCQNPLENVFLVITDHTGVTNQKDYFAASAPFFGTRLYLAPFDRKQTEKMIQINAQFFGWVTPPSMNTEIYRLTGGIPRLIKYVCKEIVENNVPAESIKRFIANPSIQFQLEKMTKLALASNKETLKKLGLLDPQGHFKSSLLDYYFKNLRVDIAFEVLPHLTKMEKTIFSLLYENKNQVVSLDQIGDFLELSGCDFSLWNIYKIISRLKTKIRDNFIIENLKGQGYSLKLA